MDLGIALEIIRRELKSGFVESRHAKEQYTDRKIRPELIQSILRNNKILGILEQDESLYKIWLNYDKYKDLNIIIRILPDNKLRIITFFPCLAERRRRK